ncbi:hypothetical protein PV10_05420 [Exophiala mesophila]|uniref:Ubiquitin 3 binding protein But2 C-terminal domain-containing protein n=1 Tax=Exophiala mesophila TaxID=212818 RepID=A0A0D1ZVF6_EXOME|nr:uncharacterized protein PV10_05420 [Exophiala mesophila]KIV90813.1 hypothetical protein PV10_05420 [Exophiala mesophila]
MFGFLIFTILLQPLGILGIPNQLRDDGVSSTLTVTVHNATSTSYVTLSTGEVPAYSQPHRTTISPSDFSTVTIPDPTFTAIAVRGGSPIHLLPINAVRQRFFVGHQVRTFCPENVERYDACPPGGLTAFTLCSMAVLHPGGQSLWATPDGTLGYTYPHSGIFPMGGEACPFTYTEDQESGFGQLTSNLHNATGLQACPTIDGRWQVFLKIEGSDVPGYKSEECLEFEAFAVEYHGPVPAWEYA